MDNTDLIVDNIYQKLSKERKQQQKDGDLPEWFTTAGHQLFTQKYLHDAKTYKEQITRVSKTLASYTPNPKKWQKKFFDIVWNGHLSLSSPIMSNTGTNKGLSVSCAGNYTEDSILGFYKSYLETAILSKYGFGTSSYISDIRPRGMPYGSNGEAEGLTPVINGLVRTVRQVSQGSSRRGAGAWYIDMEHDDFLETCDYLKNNPDDLNIGWIVKDSFIERLKANDVDAHIRFKRFLKIKLITGKGYLFFVDKANRQTTQAIKNYGISIKASNLCSEIALPSDKDHTFSCVLASMNLSKYDEWKDTDAVFVATVLLDCVCSDLIEKAKDIEGMEKVVRFTKKYRALGLGAVGFHTYFQDKGIPFESLETQFKNIEMFKYIREESYKASKWMGKEWGVPEACIGTYMRNATTMAIAPTLSSAVVCGGISEGISPFTKNIFTQGTAAGDIHRINPSLIKLLKEKGKFTKSVQKSIIAENGSVQHLNFLTDYEKSVFKTAFEIDQRVILRYASQRQPYIDQAQSINLFFSADEKEEYIALIHSIAFLDENIKSLYYIRSEAGVKASSDDSECFACEA